MTQQPNGTVSNGTGEARQRGDKGRKEVKMVIVGDGGCGKTSLLMVYAKGSFPEQYAPSVFEKYTTSVTIGNKEICLHLYDTAGQEDYDRLRPLSYQEWYPEVHHFCRGVPIVLIGCKTDLRMDKERLRKLKSSQQEPITYYQGEATCKNIQAEEYLECSAKFQENVDNVFREATLIALNGMKKEQKMKKKKRSCLLV
ncbi:rho-related GTP-binding protein RhoF isoform X2 [Rana temporaria]|uniref:rho-related GTP-binding protein RhoF isoform X2 n=1 Tax=Rana temporaria TaxID=8407 RepID=UPI001AACE025|nr:rho-related GTP-binding protein RhoF isoform X2 [Rana temporaria]